MKRLGELLIEKELITPEQLDIALKRQKDSGGSLGLNIVELNFLDDIQLGEALALQTGTPCVHPQVLEKLSPDILECLPIHIIEFYKIVPFKLESRRRLHVAVFNPIDVQTLDEISQKSRYVIKPYICSERVLFRALYLHFHIYPPINQPMISSVPVTSANAPLSGGIIQTGELNKNGFVWINETDLLGKKTKELFLETTSDDQVLKIFVECLRFTCDKLAFLYYDKDKNNLWQDAVAFRDGKSGKPCGESVNKSQFWSRFLKNPGFFYTRLPRPGNEMGWVAKMLDMQYVNSLFIAPLEVSKETTGIAIGGSSDIAMIEDNMEKIKKLHLMAICALKIQTLRKYILDIH